MIEKDLGLIRWANGPHPDAASVSIQLRPGLVPQGRFWKLRLLAIVLSFVGVALTSVLSYLGEHDSDAEEVGGDSNSRAVSLSVFDKTNEALPEVVRLIKTADQGTTLTLSGLNFHITATESDDELIDAVRAGATVRVMIIDPTEILCARYISRFVHDGDFSAECMRSLDALGSIRSKLDAGGVGSRGGSFEVRFISELPTYRCYFLDRGKAGNEMVFLTYLDGLKSSDTPLVLVRSPSRFADQVRVSLSSLWSRSTSWSEWIRSNPAVADRLNLSK